MPRVATYENEVPLARVTGAKLEAANNAGGVGGAIAQGLEEAGHAVAGFAQTRFDIEDHQATLAAKDADMAYSQAGTATMYDPTQGYLSQGGKNAIDAYTPTMKALQDKRDEVASGIDSPLARRRFLEVANQRLDTWQQVASRHAATEFAQYSHDTSAARLDQSQSDAINSYTVPDQSEKSIATGRAEIAENLHLPSSGLDEPTINQRMDAWESTTRRKVVDRMADDNPDAAQAYLDQYKGRFLGADATAAAENVRVRKAQVAAQQEHQVAIAKAGVRESLSLLSARISAGDDTISDGEFLNAERAAQSIGDETSAYRFDVARQKAGVNRETKGWTPQQWETNINDLEALGDKRTADQSIRLDQLKAIQPQRVAEFNNNPGGWAATNGHPPPPINMSDPSTIAARTQWQQTVTAATGRPTPFYTPAEAAALRSQASASPKAQLAVVDQIAAIGGARAVQAIHQVLPDDPMAARLVTLPATARASAQQGIDARKLDPNLIDGKDTKPLVEDALTTRLGSAGMLMDAGDLKAVEETAKNIYADVATKNGVAGFNQNLWNTSLHRALGGTRDAQGNWYGGVGSWNGSPVLLPQKMTQQRFETVLSRVTWPAGTGPHYRDGTEMSPAQMRKFTPVQRPDGLYEFHGPGGTVLTNVKGGIWVLNVQHISDTHR